MQKDDVVYFCQVIPNCNIYEILELKIRTVTEKWYVGVDEKTKQAQIFTEDMIDQYVFTHRVDALEALRNFKARLEND